MVEGLENLAKMDYPGRFIIMGQDVSGEQGMVVYGVTGRSTSSQARKFVYDEKHDVLRTDVTDREQLEKGSPALLIYPAIARKGSFVVVSNGAQTSLLYESVPAGIPGFDPKVSMMDAFRNQAYTYDSKLGWIDLTAYEPDSPNFTPRINGIIHDNGKRASFGICKYDEEANTKKAFHPFELWFEPGQAKLLATYTGINENPLPSFEGEPLEVALAGETQKEIAEEVYVALAPKEKEKDFRVAVACWFANEEKPYIINRHEFYH